MSTNLQNICNIVYKGAESWTALVGLVLRFGGNRLVVGGQMVFLQEVERRASEVRPTFDVDVVVNLRAEPGGVSTGSLR